MACGECVSATPLCSRLAQGIAVIGAPRAVAHAALCVRCSSSAQRSTIGTAVCTAVCASCIDRCCTDHGPRSAVRCETARRPGPPRCASPLSSDGEHTRRRFRAKSHLGNFNTTSASHISFGSHRESGRKVRRAAEDRATSRSSFSRNTRDQSTETCSTAACYLCKYKFMLISQVSSQFHALTPVV